MRMLFSCDTIRDPEIRAKLENISRVKSLAAGLLCLPNIHPKAGLESPPQFVAATRSTIVPMLSAPAMNCGLSLFTTTLTKEDFSEEFLKAFAVSLRSQVSSRVSKIQAFAGWLGFGERPALGYDLSKEELEGIFREGAPRAIKKYKLPERELEHIEFGGSTLNDEEKKNIDLKRLAPRSSYTNGRHEMGYNFGGNHFLEMYAIEKILDPETARLWNLREGQLVMFYHGGGGHATYHLGRYFARREKNTRLEKFALFFLKCIFHFGSWEGIKNFKIRWRAYFSKNPFPEIPLSSAEGKRLLQSIKIALNYGYAFRVALLKRINDALPKGSASFLWDAAHNSIRENVIGGGSIVIHRQDAAQIFPEKPVMIMGVVNSLSFIGKGSRGGGKTFWSVTPSATKVIEAYLREGKSKPENPSHVTIVSKRKNSELIRKEHVTSEGLFDTVREFEKEDIIQGVALLRPLGGLKGH